MYVVTEADATAIREVYERDGELSAAIELRRRFPGIQDNVKAREPLDGNRYHHAQHPSEAPERQGRCRLKDRRRDKSVQRDV
jgi:hypothetical protein